MEAESYIFPIVGVHVSLIIGALSYAGKYCDRNSLFGVRTRYSMQSDANWREVNDRVARVMPPVCAVAGAVAICGFFVSWLRNVEALLALIAVQLAVATYAAMKHSTRMNTDQHG